LADGPPGFAPWRLSPRRRRRLRDGPQHRHIAADTPRFATGHPAGDTARNAAGRLAGDTGDTGDDTKGPEKG